MEPIASLTLTLCLLLQGPGMDLPYGIRVKRAEQALGKKQYGLAVTEFEAALQLAPGKGEAHYNFGNALRLWGDFEGAQKALAKAIEIEPQFPRAHFALGLVLGDRPGQEQRGLAEFQKAVEQEPTYAEAHFNIGVIRWKNGDITEAIQAFHRSVELRPGSAVYRFRLGQALAKAGQTDEAMHHVEEAVRLDPDNGQARYQWAQLLRKAGRESEALEQFAKVETTKKPVAADQSAMAYQAGLTVLGQGRLDDAIAQFNEGLRQSPNDSKILTARGIAYQRIGKLERAREDFEKALTLSPKSADAHLNYAVLLMSTGKSQDAERELRQALAIDPGFVEARFNLGLLRAAQHRWEDAIAELARVVEQSPRHSPARWNLARVLRDSGDPAAAEAEYRQACKLDPMNAAAQFEYAQVLQTLGRPAEALTVLREGVKRSPGDTRLSNAYVTLLNQQGIKEQAAQIEAALNVLRIAESPGPCPRLTASLAGALPHDTNANLIRRRYADALFTCREYSPAAAQYRVLVSSEPRDVDLRLRLAASLLQSGDSTSAKQELEHATELDPSSLAALNQLATLYWTQGDRSRALTLIHQARRLDPDIAFPH